MFTKRRALVALTAAVMLTATGCGDSGSSDNASGEGGKIALLLPESKTARYESQDRPIFEQKVKDLCADCEVLYSNADQDSSKQLSQAQAALTNGAKVLVLDPVDAASAGSIVSAAKAQDVPVISYDRLISNAEVDYYISFDNEEVGRLQGTALLEKLKADGVDKSGSIVMINGSPTDSNAAKFKAGAHSVLDGQVTIGKEYDTIEWSPDNAQDEMEQAITALGKDKIVGVYAANDGTAGGAIAAMKGAGFSPIVPTTGQDAELAGIQRVVSGEQYMTVYKAIKPQAEQAATVAVRLLRGEGIPEGTTNVNNGTNDIPSTLLTPVAVTNKNVNDTVVKDGFWTVDQICTAEYASACSAIGLK